ncbi:hypothetical protein Hanom_Chr16g01426401 [Helianthus anomalus]
MVFLASSSVFVQATNQLWLCSTRRHRSAKSDCELFLSSHLSSFSSAVTV